MKRRFYETERMFKHRQDLDMAKKSISNKKLWRIYAIEMRGNPKSGFQLGSLDHFTVEAHSEESAIGLFKLNGHMNWYVTGIKEEIIIV